MDMNGLLALNSYNASSSIYSSKRACMTLVQQFVKVKLFMLHDGTRLTLYISAWRVHVIYMLIS